jgi:hypothetical protein
MNDVKTVSVPLASHFKISSSLCPSTKEEKEYMSRIPYANAVGSLMYGQTFHMQLGLSVGLWQIQVKSTGQQ